MAFCKTNVLKIYNHVIEDVISGVRNIFSDEGVDEQVLLELKALWESKLLRNKAIEINSETSKPNKTAKKPDAAVSNTVFVIQSVKRARNFSQRGVPTFTVQPTKDKMIPITLQTQQTMDAMTRTLTIHVPKSVLNGPQLQSLLTSTVITAINNLPVHLASSFLQQYVNAALQSQQQQLTINKIVMLPMDSSTAVEPKMKRKKTKTFSVEFISRGTDGATDTSEDEKTEEDEPEPLNSDDDVTDETPPDLFDTDNVMFCRFDKIIRRKNYWKFYLKDGIMNLDGQDIVFKKANGDAEW